MVGIAKATRGFTLMELLIAMALAGLVLAGTNGLVNSVMGTEAVVEERNKLQMDARFAMQRMTRTISETRYLILPLPDKPDTDWRENVREETVPASSPEGSSSKATAVLAVSLSESVDLDANGFPDADNDGDGRVDEDYPPDIAYDFASGIYLIDDGGGGFVDESFDVNDDDERLNAGDEDPVNGIDDDGDGATDEDPGGDMNADGAPGVTGVDDDGDGQIDEGNANDDDEDGSIDEDWLDAVVFYLQGDILVERHPVPWDETANGFVSGRDYIESTIAEGVTRFRVERPVTSASGEQLIDLTLELTGPTGSIVSLTSRVRLGGAL
jgi:prepilin-type N-terminal cleavage/methylation domain-containing protein